MNYTVYNALGEQIATFRYAIHAAMFAGDIGKDTQVRYGENLLWHEGHEAYLAKECIILSANRILARLIECGGVPVEHDVPH